MLAYLQQDSTGLPEALWKRGLAIAPVPLNLDGRDRKLVGYGSYIVNAQAICSDCHTNPNFKTGGDPYQGQAEQTNTDHYLAGGKKFRNGTIKSRNITPDLKSGLPADLRLFISAISLPPSCRVNLLFFLSYEMMEII